MRLQLSTWDGTNINNGNPFTAWIAKGQLANLTANPVTVARSSAFPYLSLTQLPAHVFVLGITVTQGQDVNDNRELLKGLFNITSTSRAELRAVDLDDSSRVYYLRGFPVRITPDGSAENAFLVTLAVETPVWRVVVDLTNTWNITAGTETNNITNIGNVNAKPRFEISCAAAKTGGLSYRRWIPVYSRLDTTWDFPFDLTNGLGFDTAALTTAKMQANGEDLRIMLDGVFVDRYIYNMDTTTTQIWVNLKLSPKQEATTSVTIAGSGSVSTISFEQTPQSLDFLRAMARVRNKVVLIDNEAFTFTGVDLIAYQLTGVTRAQKDTSMAAHTAPKTCRWIEHDIWMLYGDPTLPDQYWNTDYEPIFDLNSSNTVLFYATAVADRLERRPGSWKSGVSRSDSGLSYVFNANLNTFDDPGYVLGLAMVAIPTRYNAAIETATLWWSLYHPTGITQVDFDVRKFSTGSFPDVCGVQYLENDRIWLTNLNLAMPAVLNSWVLTLSESAVLPGTYNNVRFAMDGSLSPVEDERAMVQAEAITVQVGGDVPEASIGSEVAIHWFDFTLTNNETGEYIKVQGHTLIGSGALLIDCEAKTAQMEDGSPLYVTLSSEREAWLDLLPGVNQLQYDDTGTNDVTVETTHTDGNL